MIPKNKALSQIDGKFTPVRATKPELNPDGSVRKPAQGKACYIKDWQKNPKTLAFCEGEIKANRATGYGLILGNGIVAIDFDGPTSTNIAGAIGNWLVEAVNNTLAWTSGKADGYYQVAFLIPESHLSLWESIKRKDFKEYKGVKGENGDHLEIRYNSMQSVLPPSWHSGDLYYQWINESEIATLTEEQSQDLLNAYHYKEKSVKDTDNKVERKETLTQYDVFLTNFTLPINESIPLEICLARITRENLSGVSEGSRDETGAAIARDLIGTANYLTSIGQRFDGDPYSLFSEYCSKCNPPVGNADLEKTYKSALKDNPEPCLSIDKIFNNIASYKWREIKPTLLKSMVSNTRQKLEQTFQMSPGEKEAHIKQICESLITQNATQSLVESTINSLCNEGYGNYSSLKAIYSSMLKEREQGENLLDEIAKIKSTLNYQSFSLERYIPTGLATPLLRIAKIIGTSSQAVLTAMLPYVTSLINPNTSLTLIENSDFKAKPIFFAGLCGESGSSKTPTINIFQKALQILQNEADQDYKEALKEYESYKGSPEDKPSPPNPREYFLSDTTIEKLAQVVDAQPNHGFLLFKDELSDLVNSANSYRAKGGDIDKLLSCRDGSGFKVTRASGKRFSNPKTSISILGGITPDVLRKQFKQVDIGTGYWQRFNFCRLDLIPCVFPDAEISISITPMLVSLFENIENAPIREYKMCVNGRAIYRKFFEEMDHLRVTDKNSMFRSFYNKQKNVAGGLALSLYEIHCGFNQIERATIIPSIFVELGVDLCKFYINEMKAIMLDIDDSGNELTPQLIEIIKFGERNPSQWLSAREIKQSSHRLKKISPNEIRELFLSLTQSGYGETQGNSTRIKWRLGTTQKSVDVLQKTVDVSQNPQNPYISTDSKNNGYTTQKSVDKITKGVDESVDVTKNTESIGIYSFEDNNIQTVDIVDKISSFSSDSESVDSSVEESVDISKMDNNIKTSSTISTISTVSPEPLKNKDSDSEKTSTLSSTVSENLSTLSSTDSEHQPMDTPPLYERLVAYCSYEECSESSFLYGLFNVSSFWELDDEQAWILDKELTGLLANMAAAQRKADWEEI
jgi:hypothetical protein